MKPLADISFELYAAFVILEEAGICCRCRASHYFFVNRFGKTLCVGCDSKAQQIREAGAKGATNGA